MIKISLAILVAFSSFQLKAASIHLPLSGGELISANSLNIRFLEIKTKLSNKLINVNLEAFNDNEIIKAEKINININTLKNEGVSLSNIEANAPIKASDINTLFSELTNFVDNQVIYLAPNSSAYYNIFAATGNRTDKVRVI